MINFWYFLYNFIALPLLRLFFFVAKFFNSKIKTGIEDRKKLFEKIAGALAPDGYLIIGSTESLTGICPMFEPQRHLRSVFYQLKSL